jgi:hypothetical protein
VGRELNAEDRWAIGEILSLPGTYSSACPITAGTSGPLEVPKTSGGKFDKKLLRPRVMTPSTAIERKDHVNEP